MNMNLTTAYDLNKIKFATDEATFKRAVGLYESGKVTDVEALEVQKEELVRIYEKNNRVL